MGQDLISSSLFGRRVRWLVSIFAGGTVSVCSCGKGPQMQAPSSNTLFAEQIQFQYTLYFLPRPTKDALATTRSLLAKDFPNLKEVVEAPSGVDGRYVHLEVINDVAGECPPPDLESLRYFGHGLSREQAVQLQRSGQALVLDFAHPKRDVWTGLRAANKIVSQIAQDTGGLIWDGETREVFAPEAWKQKRLESWTENEHAPDVSQQIVIHSYKKEDLVRAITLGMRKMGLPDVVADDFPWSLNRNMGHLINLFCQAMAEGSVVAETGPIDLDLRGIRNPKVREAQLPTLLPNATAVARLVLKKGTWEEGDPQNRLIEFSFDRSQEPELHARQEKLLGELFGWEDTASQISHTDELLAASQRAKQRLPSLQKEFSRGLKPGEFILLKSPFSTPDGGREWMWVEVINWEGDEVTGLLKNEPVGIPDLHGGQTVTIPIDDVFDFIRQHPDGTQEGNETGKIIERQNATRNNE